ncbi:MAG: hypothetical protein HC889_19350 [Synechococcaceae cyanobacterium SM1_2_3]|nr:hypothetical protein [Synechococcaceae cyanobacterium SM1_2_3]
MKSTDKEAFGIAFTECMAVYEKAVTPALLTVWFASLQAYEWAAVQAAFGRYITDPRDCRFAPKPGDIIRHIELAGASDNRPGADEAWGMLLRVIGDERETGVLSDEMRIGWTACQPIFDLGDEVGARLAFRESYHREVENARKMAVALRWTPTLGTTARYFVANAAQGGRRGRENRFGGGAFPAPRPDPDCDQPSRRVVDGTGRQRNRGQDRREPQATRTDFAQRQRRSQETPQRTAPATTR